MMAYMPAGEERDSDEDWGLVDDADDWDQEVKAPPTQTTAATPPQSYLLTAAASQAGGDVPQSFQSSTSSPSPLAPPRRAWVPGASPWPGAAGVPGVQDFQRATVTGSLEGLRACLNHGQPVDQHLRQGWTALMFAAHHGQAEATELLLQKGADPNHSIDMFTPLMACMTAGGEDKPIAQCCKLLVEAGADVNSRDRHHVSPLMLAAREGRAGAVATLLANGAKVNTQGAKGWTALTWAVQRGRGAVVAELLAHKADPNIQHLDRLTVMDLAAHLPSDEMLALLEGRPANITDASGEVLVRTRARQPHKDSGHSILDMGDQAKLTDLRYGELEVFLHGLDLAHLVPVCQAQLIDLAMLLTLTEADLVAAGIDQLGARKKILDAAHTVHRKDWEPQSLVSIHYSKKMMCSDAVAMVANSSKHIRYLESSIKYLKGQLDKHPECVLLPTDKVNPTMLARHAAQASNHARNLTAELATLQAVLAKEMGQRCSQPPDLVADLPSRSRAATLARVSGLTLCVAVPVLMYCQRDSLGHVWDAAISHVSSAFTSVSNAFTSVSDSVSS